MSVIICPVCGTRVLPSPDGECPACRRPCLVHPPLSQGDESEREAYLLAPAPDSFFAAARSLQRRLEEIASRLHQDFRPTRCFGCGAWNLQVRVLRVQHRDFAVELPVGVCQACAHRVLKNRREVSYVIAGLLVLLAFAVVSVAPWISVGAIVLAVLIGLSAERVTPRLERRELLERMLGKVEEYRRLLESYPETHLALSTASEPKAAPPEELVTRFNDSLRLFREVIHFSDPQELRGSAIPVCVYMGLAELVARATVEFFAEHQTLQGTHVQVAGAILPGRRNAFEIQGLSGQAAKELQRCLADLPSWPVRSPVMFAVLYRAPGQAADRSEPLDQPFYTWWLQVTDGVPQAMTIQEVVCRFHKLPAEGPTDEQDLAFHLDELVTLRQLLPHSVGLALFHAEVLTASGQLDDALGIHDELIARHAGDVYFRRLRAACLEAADRPEHAAAECQAILSQFPGDADVLGHLAHLQLKMDRPGDAVATASQALQLEPQPRVYYVRARAHMALHQPEKAMNDADACLSQDPDLPEAYLLRAGLRLSEGDCDGALADLAQYHEKHGSTLESLYLQACAFRGKGDLGAAVRVYSEVLERMPDQPVLRVYRANFLAEAGKLELARDDCDEVLRQFPENAAAYATRAAIRLESGQPAEALEDAERALNLGAETGRLHLVRGLAKASLGDVEQGEADLTRGLEIEPQSAALWFHRAGLRTTLQQYEAATADLTSALELVPGWIEALVQRGFLRLVTDEPDAALDDFEAALRVAPRTPEALRGRAAVQTQRGQKREALEDLNRAIELDPENVAARLARTNLLLEEQNREAAKADLDSALQITPNLVPALFQRAHLHLTRGEHEAARRDFDAILKYDPQAVSAFLGRSVAWEQAGNRQRSESDLDEAAHLAPEAAAELELTRLLWIASTAYQAEQFDKAIDYATQALTQSPGHGQAYSIRAAAYWYSEQFVEAADDYSRLIEQGADAQDSLYGSRGQVYAEMGEFEKALDDLNRAVAAARSAGDSLALAYSLNGRGRALAGLGEFDEAERDFAESLRLQPDNGWLHFNRGLLHVARGEPDAAAVCFTSSLTAASPPLTPRKRARAAAFLKAH